MNAQNGKYLIHTIISGVLLLVLQVANGHPYHASTTILEYNGETETLEFSLRMLTEDVDKVICPYSSCPEYEDKQIREDALASYIGAHLRLTFAEQETNEINLLGAEFNFREVWAYYEMRLPGSTVAENQFCLDYDIFTELNLEQINTIDYKSKNIRRAVSLTIDKTSACFLLQEP
jgi:hypothetical protein